MIPKTTGAGALVIIPTFNEIENLEAILGKVFEAVPAAHVLIVDDGSPDGTGQLAEQMAGRDDRVKVIHRTGKQGLGTAYLRGFSFGVAEGYNFLVEFDADGSHPASKLPEMLGIAESRSEIGLVIGSRWTKGGQVVDWPKQREFLSRGANAYAAFLLRIPVKDSTAGFRVYRTDLIKGLRLEKLDSKGYCFQIDMTIRSFDAGSTIVEVPITFRDREHGQSKMSGAIIFEAMWKVTYWGFARIFSSRGAGRR